MGGGGGGVKLLIHKGPIQRAGGGCWAERGGGRRGAVRVRFITSVQLLIKLIT